MPVPTPPTAWQDYLFDLQGYLVLPRCVSSTHLAEMNAAIDAWIAAGCDWNGAVRIERERYEAPSSTRTSYFGAIEGGSAFEEMIDHPAWLGCVRRYVDNDGLHLWQNFVNVITCGGATAFHSGGHTHQLRGNFDYHDGAFHCGLITVILALTDIGPGDGPTVLVPGSHKSHLPNPAVHAPPGSATLDHAAKLDALREVSVDLHLQAGDVALFTEGILHGSRPRTNPGQRRVLIFKYTPFWTRCRFGYEPSEELLARLTPERRTIVRPIEPRRPPALTGATGVPIPSRA